MSYQIEYFATDGKYIKLNVNGEIEINNTNFIIKNEPDLLIMNYTQANILKKMIIAQHELEKR